MIKLRVARHFQNSPKHVQIIKTNIKNNYECPLIFSNMQNYLLPLCVNLKNYHNTQYRAYKT